MSRYPDVAPTISVGLGYANYVSYVNFEVQGITEHLRNSGLSDEQILDTTIVFSDKHPERVRGTKVVLGQYTKADRTATVYASYHALQTFLSDPRQDAHVDTMANNTLVHELEHRIAHVDSEQSRINSKHQRSVAARTLSSWAIASAASTTALNRIDFGMPTILTAGLASIVSSATLVKLRNREGAAHRRYLKHPEEVRCRAAELQAPKLVHVFSRPLFFRDVSSAEAIQNVIQEVRDEYFANVAQRQEREEQQQIAAKIDRLSALISFILRAQS